jgi:hypothetical protein
MKFAYILPVVALAFASGGVAAAFADQSPATSQPMNPSTLETLRSDLLRFDDGGAKARAAVDQAVKAGRPDLLLLALTNHHYDVRIHAIEALGQCPVADQVCVLDSALSNPKLWTPEAKVGELIASQQRLITAMSATIQTILGQPKPQPELLDPVVREQLRTELKAALVKRLKADAERWDDGGRTARAACDTAVKLQSPDVLLTAFNNRLYDVKIHSLNCLAQLDRAEQVAALNRILGNDALWVKEKKIGELIVSQEQFALKVRALAAKILQKDLQAVDLFEASSRNRLAADLAGK